MQHWHEAAQQSLYYVNHVRVATGQIGYLVGMAPHVEGVIVDNRVFGQPKRLAEYLNTEYLVPAGIATQAECLGEPLGIPKVQPETDDLCWVQKRYEQAQATEMGAALLSYPAFDGIHGLCVPSLAAACAAATGAPLMPREMSIVGQPTGRAVLWPGQLLMLQVPTQCDSWFVFGESVWCQCPAQRMADYGAGQKSELAEVLARLVGMKPAEGTPDTTGILIGKQCTVYPLPSGQSAPIV